MAWGLVRAGRYVQSLALMVMKPDDLLAFNLDTYSRADSVEAWGRDDLIESGLNPEESSLLQNLSMREGQLLLLGAGGGREAISLARAGFQVTVLDFVPAMVETCLAHAKKRGLNLRGEVLEVSRFEGRGRVFDVIWISGGLYSSIPSRRRRVEMLRRLKGSVGSGGVIVCQWYWRDAHRLSPLAEAGRTLFSTLTRGNLFYEKGDILLSHREFIHAFSSRQDLEREFREAGLEPACLVLSEEWSRGGCLLRPMDLRGAGEGQAESPGGGEKWR